MWEGPCRVGRLDGTHTLKLIISSPKTDVYMLRFYELLATSRFVLFLTEFSHWSWNRAGGGGML